MKFCFTPEGTRVAYSMPSPLTSDASLGMPLVLLHGFCEDQTLWSGLIPIVNVHPLILIDLPGFGASELPEQSDMFSYARAIMSVLDAEKVEQCVLVGHSMGGYVGLEFAAHWPERLAGLGLFHSHPFTDAEERKSGRRRGIETLQAGKRDLYVTQLFPNLFAPAFVESNPAILQALINNGKKQGAEGIIAGLQAMLDRRDHTITLQEMACPVLFILGTLDTLVPPEQGLQAALMPAVADVRLFPSLSHMGMWEAPQESATILHSFWMFCQAK